MADNKQTPRMGGGGGPQALSQAGEKPKNFKATFNRLLKYLKPYRFQIFLVLVLAIIGTVFMVLGPRLVTEPALNTIFEGAAKAFNPQTGQIDPTLMHIDLDKVASILMLGIGIYVISMIASTTMSVMMASITQKIVYALRKEVDYKLTKLPLKYYDGTPVGETLSRITNDVETISTTLQQSLTQTITSIVTIIGYIIMMLTIDFRLTLVAIATVPLSLIITVIIAKQSQKFFGGQQRVLGNLNGQIEEVYGGQSVIKVFNQEQAELDKFKVKNKELYQYGWKAQFVSGIIMPVLNLIGNLGYVLVAIIGVQGVISGTLNAGQVTAFIQYMQGFTQPIVQTANISNVIQSAIAAAERVFELLDEQEQQPSPSDSFVPTTVRGDIQFNHVNFGYEPGQTIITDLSLDAKSGQTVAIVGPTGAGKTTLVNLLMRFYEINGGDILIDGHSNSHMKRETVRSMFGMVLQDTWLFNGTIKDNIRYSKLDATDEEIYEAARKAHVDTFIRSLPHGYDTEINEEASNISQGQKQLLTIARAILANPSLMILDEATSSVDTRTEQLIQKAMTNLMKGRTSFVIAHRLSTIKNADMILVMNHGDIIEQGNHETLMGLNGFYANLYNSQFSDAEEE